MNAIRTALAACAMLMVTAAPSPAQSGLAPHELAQLQSMRIIGTMAANARFQVGQLPNGQLVTIAPSGRMTVLPPGFSHKGFVILNPGVDMSIAGNMQPGIPSNRVAGFPAYPLPLNAAARPVQSHTYARLMPNSKLVTKKKSARTKVTARATR